MSAMPSDRHAYIAFYPSDWLAGTARMSPLHRLVYFEICCRIWDKGVACPFAELPIMLKDVPNWEQIVKDLLATGKLSKDKGRLVNNRALHEGQKALDLWQRKSRGGRLGAQSTNSRVRTPVDSPGGSRVQSPEKTPAVEPEPEPEPEPFIEGRAGLHSGRPGAGPVGCRLPEGWMPEALPQEIVALTLFWPPDRIKQELNKFTDYFKAQEGRRGVSADWDAVWRNWLRRADDYSRAAGGKPSGWAWATRRSN